MLGGFLTEKFSRSKFDVNKTEKLIRAISKSSTPEEMKEKVSDSELADDHKEILIKIISNYDIGPLARKALATKLAEEEELQYSSITQKTDYICQIRPTMGLMVLLFL